MIKKEYALGLLTVLFWSTSATAFKLTLQHMDVLQLLFYSIIAAVLILGIYLLIQGKIDRVFKLSRKEYQFYVLLGVLNPFAYYLMVIKAYDLLPAQIVQPINYTWVVTLSLLSVPLLKQPLSRLQMLATLICYSGVVILSYRDSTTGLQLNYFGIFLAVACTFIWALYWIYNVRSKQDPIIAIFLNFLFSIPFVGSACLLFSSFTLSNWKGLYGACWIGCFEFGFPFITWITALKSVKNTNNVTNLIFMTPFMSLIFIRTVLGEELLPQTYFGLMFILAGIFIQRYEEYSSFKSDS
ncbi:conserved membrane hypothetical protein [Desulfamplus magnetovallimortis]|uniref:EamA domain-containing protein n=1 Tax=Desulfamplus magnetovallimortis TaxID=1246637 RepID=A0A1W1HAN9_9BACT|nr:DMT family transporter [Desulfamplus magnetovallimortis]SLM29564.1 conserved membrane hypothetical protein [Desulfamplus magnetovallimortis]